MKSTRVSKPTEASIVQLIVLEIKDVVRKEEDCGDPTI